MDLSVVVDTVKPTLGVHVWSPEDNPDNKFTQLFSHMNRVAAENTSIVHEFKPLLDVYDEFKLISNDCCADSYEMPLRFPGAQYSRFNWDVFGGAALFAHKFAFIVRASSEEIGRRAVDELMGATADVCFGTTSSSVFPCRLGEIFGRLFENLPLVTDLSTKTTDEWSSVFDPYYMDQHNLQTGVLVDDMVNLQSPALVIVEELPYTYRVPCFLNYLNMFAGILNDMSKTDIGLYPPPWLREQLASGTVEVTLKPYVLRQITSLTTRRQYVPILESQVFGIDNVVFGTPTQELQIVLPMSHCMVALCVQLTLAEHLGMNLTEEEQERLIIPRVTRLVFQANNDPDMRIERMEDNFITRRHGITNTAVIPIAPTALDDTAQLFDQMILKRLSVNLSRLETVTVSLTIDNPTMGMSSVKVIGLTANMLIRLDMMCGVAFSS